MNAPEVLRTAIKSNKPDCPRADPSTCAAWSEKRHARGEWGCMAIIKGWGVCVWPEKQKDGEK